MIAHITLTCVLDGVGRGAAMSTPLTTVYQQIGERVDHECFLRHVKETDPNGWERVDRWVLQSQVKGYASKIKAATGLTEIGLSYEFLDPDTAVAFGSWCFDALWSLTKWFEKVQWISGRGKQRRIQYYVGLSEEGLKYRDLIQKAADEQCFEAWPMLTSPGVGYDNAVRG